MKLKSKIFSLVLLPLLILGCATCVLGYFKINSVLTDSIENGLQAAAISVRDTLEHTGEGEYRVDDSGNMLKGDFNISDNSDLADNLKQSSDMDITVFFGDTRYMTSVTNNDGNREVGTQASEAVVEQVITNGQDYFSTNADILGHKYFGYYVPLYQNNSNDIIGMVFAGMPQADAKAQIFSIVAQIILIMAVVIVFCAITGFIIVRNMTAALTTGEKALQSMADGSLNVKITGNALQRKDEIGIINRAIMKLNNEMSAIIGNIKQQSDALTLSSNDLREKATRTAENMQQVDVAVDEIAQGATGQAEQTQTATENVMDMGNMIHDTVKEVEHMNANAKIMKETAQSAFTILNELKDINENAKESIETIAQQTNTTNVSAQKIREATTLITDIAEETNLLSLNASIEAARAGEQGRGFAVVASQIQKLAEQSNESARKIDEIITQLISDSDKAVHTMEEVKEIIEKQSVNVQNTNTAVGDVLDRVEASISAMEKITKHSENLDHSRASVIDTVENLAAIAQENAASTEETAASMSEVNTIVNNISENASELNKIADDMRKSIQIFKF